MRLKALHCFLLALKAERVSCGDHSRKLRGMPRAGGVTARSAPGGREQSD